MSAQQLAAEQRGEAISLYLDLLKGALTGAVHQDSYETLGSSGARLLGDAAAQHLRNRQIELVRRLSDPETRRRSEEEGRRLPFVGETMVGRKRLDSLQAQIEQILRDGVPGDLIETGVWRGGATILMRAVLRAHGISDRSVWVADSFEGLPPPNPDRYPADEGNACFTQDRLRVAADVVRANFRRYGLLDDQVRFLAGWFRDTLPTVKHRQWALIRLDGDMYESTTDGLLNLYPGLTVGGYVVIDDYGATPMAQRAVDDFRSEQGIDEPLETIDWTGVYWRRER